MYKKLLLVSIACLLSFMFSDAAWSSVVGTWDVTGVVKLKASAKGRSVSVTVPYVDTFTFGADSSFSMIGMGGTYTVKKKKFTVDDDVNVMMSAPSASRSASGLGSPASVRYASTTSTSQPLVRSPSGSTSPTGNSLAHRCSSIGCSDRS